MSTGDQLSIAKYSFIPINECNMCGSSEECFELMGRRLNNSQGFWPSKKAGLTTTIIKCGSCGLIFSNPMPKVVNIMDHYNIPPEIYWEQARIEKTEGYFRKQIDWYYQLSSNNKSPEALDIGAGLGKCMKALLDTGFRVRGIEPSETFVQKAIEINDIPQEQLQLCSIEEASFKEESFDFINFGAVLEHLHDPAYCIGKALKWLKPRELIHIEVPSASWLVGRIVNLVYKLRGQHFVTNLSPMHQPYHLFEFMLDAFRINGKKT